MWIYIYSWTSADMITLIIFLFLAVSCDPLDDPTNGQVSFGATTFQSRANYSCNAGYILMGNMTRSCQADGEWSDTDPSCERKDEIHLDSMFPLSMPQTPVCSGPYTPLDLRWSVVPKVVLSKSGPGSTFSCQIWSPQTTFGCQNWSPLPNTLLDDGFCFLVASP